MIFGKRLVGRVMLMYLRYAYFVTDGRRMNYQGRMCAIQRPDERYWEEVARRGEVMQVRGRRAIERMRELLEAQAPGVWAEARQRARTWSVQVEGIDGVGHI